MKQEDETITMMCRELINVREQMIKVSKELVKMRKDLNATNTRGNQARGNQARSSSMELKPQTLNLIRKELTKARAKHPDTNNLETLLIALGEEYGEVCKAYLDKESPESLREELAQVIVVCVRILEEGIRQ